MTHRSAAPTAASALTDCRTGSNGCACRRPATSQPAVSSTGAAAADTRPHHGTRGSSSCTGTTVGRGGLVRAAITAGVTLVRMTGPAMTYYGTARH